jgi:hypothetical protein
MAIVMLCSVNGILRGLYRTKNMDRLAATIPHQIPTFRKDSHRELTLREAAHPSSAHTCTVWV